MPIIIQLENMWQHLHFQHWGWGHKRVKNVMKAYGALGVPPHLFLTSTTAGDEWWALQTDQLTPSTHLAGGWTAPRSSLDTREEKNLLSKPGKIPGFPCCQAHSVVTTATTLSQLIKMRTHIFCVWHVVFFWIPQFTSVSKHSAKRNTWTYGNKVINILTLKNSVVDICQPEI